MYPSATTRTVIVCLPADTVGDVLTACSALAEHVDGPTTLHQRFIVRHRRLIGWLTRFLTTHLVHPRRRRTGTITYAAGGRLSRLNLTLAGQIAWFDALARFTAWHYTTADLPKASPWETFLARHQQNPSRLSLDEARRTFLRQPAVSAMLAHNAVPTARHQLDPYELDGFQAGHVAYATRYMLAAVAGDAMLTADGRFLQPASGSFVDIVAYLKEAAGHVHGLRRRHQIVAMTV